MRRNSPVVNQKEDGEKVRRDLLFRALTAGMMGNRISYGGTKTFNGLRDIYEALGYPKIDQIRFQDYWTRYKRQDIASRIVEMPVEGSWAQAPVIQADGDKTGTLQAAWEALNERVGIYSALIRADILSGIGRYGVLLLGLKDNATDFSQPAEKATDLLYLQPFTELNAQIKTYEIDPTNPRYGQPTMYSLHLAQVPGMTSQVVMDVHYSRALHLADNILDSNIFGVPRLENVFNNLLDLAKITGGSAEMFWQGAFQGMAFNVKEGYEIGESDLLLLNDEIQKYVHGMERYMKLKGMEVQQLGPNTTSPKDQADLQITMISIAKKIPKRILEGNEQGKLASSQDGEEWAGRCDHRRKQYVEPRILRPFIDRLGALGILKVPAKYSVEWPDLSTPSDKDRADVGNVRTIAITKYAATPEAQLIVPQEQYLSDIMQLPDDVVERIMAASEIEQTQAMADQAEAELQQQADESPIDPTKPNGELV